MGMELEVVARQLLRAVGGKRSRVAFARKLGYRGNPVADWEASRGSPTAAEALRACEAAGIDVVAAFARFHRVALARRKGESRWVHGSRSSVAAWGRPSSRGALVRGERPPESRPA